MVVDSALSEWLTHWPTCCREGENNRRVAREDRVQPQSPPSSPGQVGWASCSSQLLQSSAKLPSHWSGTSGRVQGCWQAISSAIERQSSEADANRPVICEQSEMLSVRGVHKLPTDARRWDADDVMTDRMGWKEEYSGRCNDEQQMDWPNRTDQLDIHNW